MNQPALTKRQEAEQPDHSSGLSWYRRKVRESATAPAAPVERMTTLRFFAGRCAMPGTETAVRTEVDVRDGDLLDQVDDANLKLGDGRVWAAILQLWCNGGAFEGPPPTPETHERGVELINRVLRETLGTEDA